MSVPTTAAELIDHTLTRFHQSHRSELPASWEMHMFKEEMRLFPTMEQGGNTLIVHLIGDMQAEHLDHADVAAELERRMADLVAPAGTGPDVAALRGALAKLFDDLTQHVHLEEVVLFPMFGVRPAS